MSYDTFRTAHEIMALALEDEPLSVVLNRALKILADAPRFLHRPAASIFSLEKSTRTLRLEAEVGMPPVFVSNCRNVSYDACCFGEVARTGEAMVIQQGTCESCPGHCEKHQHAIPLKIGSAPIAILSVSLTENGPPEPHQLDLLGAITPILARIIKQHLAMRGHARMASLVHENPQPILECDTEGRVVYGNPAVRKIMWQHSIDAQELLPENHGEYIQTCMANQAPMHVQNTVKHGTFSWTYVHVPEHNSVHIYGLDITDHRLIETQLSHDSMHDNLTGLPNRNYIMSLIKSELSLVKRRSDYTFALLLLDIDSFKSVIESLGYPAAETVLKEVGRRLESWKLRDNVVARLGGDEFAIVVEDIENATSAMEFAQSISRRMGDPIQVDSHSIGITISIGVAIGNSEVESPEILLQNASTAVYRGKRTGSNRIELFNKAMHVSAITRLKVQAELKNAIETGELRVFFQPVFSLADLRLRGFEALVRWQHPEKGLLLPGHFINIAEETGLIHALGTFVLATVCTQLAEWKTNRLPIAWVSVNVSTHQFQLDNLVSDIINVVERSGADPHRLFVEITEGTAAKSPERACRMMTELRDKGIRIALDDFGTGYSSMSYLKRFPIDSLKLDRSFIIGLPENNDDAAIATSVISMAKSLGMKVVAEGVEYERQAMFLRSMGCDEVQGFLYGHPMPIEQATALLRVGKPPLV